MTSVNTHTNIAPPQNARFAEDVRDDASLVLRSSGAWTNHTETTVDVDGYQYVLDRKSTRLNSSHVSISYAVFCLKKKIKIKMKRYIESMKRMNKVVVITSCTISL